MTKVLCGCGRLLEVGLKRKRYPPTGLEHRVPLHENQVVFYLHFSDIQKCAKFTLEEKRVLVWSQKVDDRSVTVAKFRRMVKGCALLQNIQHFEDAIVNEGSSAMRPTAKIARESSGKLVSLQQKHS